MAEMHPSGHVPAAAAPGGLRHGTWVARRFGADDTRHFFIYEGSPNVAYTVSGKFAENAPPHSAHSLP